MRNLEFNLLIYVFDAGQRARQPVSAIDVVRHPDLMQ
jgi:hypothetical protein